MEGSGRCVVASVDGLMGQEKKSELLGKRQHLYIVSCSTDAVEADSQMIRAVRMTCTEPRNEEAEAGCDTWETRRSA